MTRRKQIESERDATASHRDVRVEIMTSWEHMTDDGLRDHLHAARCELELLLQKTRTEVNAGRVDALVRYTERVRDVLQYRIVQAAAERAARVVVAETAAVRETPATDDAPRHVPRREGFQRWTFTLDVRDEIVADGFDALRMLADSMTAAGAFARFGRGLGAWRDHFANLTVTSEPDAAAIKRLQTEGVES